MTFALLALATSSFALMQSMTFPVLPQIKQELDTSQMAVTWVITAYLLSASVATSIVGKLGDIHGKRRLLVLSLLCLSLGSLVAALAPNITVMLVGRVVSGIGGGVLPLSFGIIRDEFPEERVAGAIAFVSSLTAVGFGAGIVVSGPIVEAIGYPWLFWLPFIVTTLGAVGAHLLIPESEVRAPGRVPLVPAVLLAGWLICLLVALSQGPAWGWGSPAVIGLLVVAVIVSIVWVQVETRIEIPLIDMRMMRLKGVWTTNLVALMLGFATYATSGFMPQLFQTPVSTGYGFGADVTESGLLLPSASAAFVGGVLSAPSTRLVGSKVVVVVGCLLSAGGTVYFAASHAQTGGVIAANVLIGFGTGLAMSGVAPLVVAAVRPDQTGVASGMSANIRTIGGSIGSAVMATIVASRLDEDGFPEHAGYVHGFLLLAAGLLVGAVAALLIPSVSRYKLQGPFG